LVGESPRRLWASNRRGVYQHNVGFGGPTNVMVTLIIWSKN